MNLKSLLDLARMIKHYSLGNSSYYVGGADALSRFLESQGYACRTDGFSLVVSDSDGKELIRL